MRARILPRVALGACACDHLIQPVSGQPCARRGTTHAARSHPRPRDEDAATDIWFYHLQARPLASALPQILGKARERGWRIVVQTVDDLRLKALDDLLWTFDKASFLPHATMRDTNAAAQPILLTTDAETLNGAALRVYVEGAEIALDSASAPYERAILMFDGGNEAELDAARAQWSRLKNQGFTLAYWQQSDAGRWERKA